MHRRGFLLTSSAAIATLVANGTRPSAVLAGPCAGGFAEQILTPPATRIGRGGGVLVGTFDMGGATNLGSRGPRHVSLHRGELEVPIRAERIAPGLVRLVPVEHAIGAYTLRSSFGTLAFMLVETDASVPVLAETRRVQMVRTMVERRGRRLPSYTITAIHRRPQAETTRCLVARDAATHAPLLFAMTASDTTTTVLYETPGSCSGTVEGTVAPMPPRAIELVAINGEGMSSAPSPRIVVR